MKEITYKHFEFSSTKFDHVVDVILQSKVGKNHFISIVIKNLDCASTVPVLLPYNGRRVNNVSLIPIIIY